MKKTNYLVPLFWVMFFLISCGSAKIERFEVENYKVGSEGTVFLKVWSYGGRSQDAVGKAKRNAIEAVLFRGVPENNGVKGRKPLVSISQREEHKKFFEEFLSENGSYHTFVNLSNEGSVRASDRLRVGNQYKIGVLVLVQLQSLRTYLEEKGIIKGFADGF